MIDALCIDLRLESDLARDGFVDLVVIAMSDARSAIDSVHHELIVQRILIGNTHTKRSIAHQVLVEVIFRAQHAEAFTNLTERSGRTEFGISIHMRHLPAKLIDDILVDLQTILCILNAVADRAEVKRCAAPIRIIVERDKARVRVHMLITE